MKWTQSVPGCPSLHLIYTPDVVLDQNKAMHGQRNTAREERKLKRHGVQSESSGGMSWPDFLKWKTGGGRSTEHDSASGQSPFQTPIHDAFSLNGQGSGGALAGQPTRPDLSGALNFRGNPRVPDLSPPQPPAAGAYGPGPQTNARTQGASPPAAQSQMSLPKLLDPVPMVANIAKIFKSSSTANQKSPEYSPSMGYNNGANLSQQGAGEWTRSASSWAPGGDGLVPTHSPDPLQRSPLSLTDASGPALDMGLDATLAGGTGRLADNGHAAIIATLPPVTATESLKITTPDTEIKHSLQKQIQLLEVNSALTGELSSAKGQVNTLQQRISSLEGELNVCKATSKGQALECIALRKDKELLEDTKGRLQVLIESGKDDRDKVNELEKSLDELEEEHNKKLEELAQLQTTLQDVNGQLRQRQEELAISESSRQHDMTAAEAIHKKELANAQSAFQKEENRLKDLWAEEKQQKELAQLEQQKLAADNKRYRDETFNLGSLKMRLEGDLKTQKGEATKWKTSFQSLVNERKELLNQNSILSRELNEIKPWRTRGVQAETDLKSEQDLSRNFRLQLSDEKSAHSALKQRHKEAIVKHGADMNSFESQLETRDRDYHDSLLSMKITSEQKNREIEHHYEAILSTIGSEWQEKIDHAAATYEGRIQALRDQHAQNLMTLHEQHKEDTMDLRRQVVDRERELVSNADDFRPVTDGAMKNKFDRLRRLISDITGKANFGGIVNLDADMDPNDFLSRSGNHPYFLLQSCIWNVLKDGFFSRDYGFGVLGSHGAGCQAILHLQGGWGKLFDEASDVSGKIPKVSMSREFIS